MKGSDAILIFSFAYSGIVGTNSRNLNFSYCTKDPNDFNDEGYWPNGDYCILQHGNTCPPGAFKKGTIHWDDEDSRNKNSAGGELPSGRYGRNTEIDYCCRNDGKYLTEIRLPTSNPFYLLRHTTYCQRVKGMYVREETVFTDDEDKNNKNSVSGSHPYGPYNGQRNLKLFYCYYSSLE